MRVRYALRFSSSTTTATNLGFVFINEESLKRVWDRSLGFSFGLAWPRQVYGRVVQELAEQGAKVVALDIIFAELRPDHPPVQLADGSLGPGSDEFFGHQMACASNVVLALTPDVTPPSLFLTNAAALGDISTEKDEPEGILRRAKAFRTYRIWHAAFRQMEEDPDYAVDLSKARVEPRQIVLPRPRELGDIKIALDEDGNFDLADFAGDKLPPGMAPKAKPFTEERVWHMGVVVAARALNLDLDHAQVDLPHGRIVLSGPNHLQRVLAVDRDGCFFIDWCLPEEDPRLARQPIHSVLAQYQRRLKGLTNQLANIWQGKSVVIGSRAQVGNNLTDRGATPLSPDTLLVSEHWNVANSIITGHFIQRSPLALDLVLIMVLGTLAAIMTWQLPVLRGSLVVISLIVIYVLLAAALYVHSRYWIPVVMPVGGACFMTYVFLVAWRAVFEEAEGRRIKSIFSTVVSPKVMNELLRTRTLELGGALREITVMFADVRGFTHLTDSRQEQVAEFVRQHRLSGLDAQACHDEQARGTLRTINDYLGLVAETLIRQDGTWDKFIGDCVMAFWGAPTPNPTHAVSCVRAAIETQRAIYQFNRARLATNQEREPENLKRQAAGLPLQPLLPILYLGTGINTGAATVGLMGSAVKGVVRSGNYTVFGREVNLASRLEGASGRGRIFIGESTYNHLLRDAPELAASCVLLPPQNLKGISAAVTAYEVPWQLPETQPLEAHAGAALPNVQLAAAINLPPGSGGSAAV
jgi:class 3 adenylate cyclase/CHASE2 domain-containing sensor protein